MILTLLRVERWSESSEMKFSKDKHKALYVGTQNKIVITKLENKWLRLQQAMKCLWLTKITLWTKKKKRKKREM